jgi:hypothetical protein
MAKLQEALRRMGLDKVADLLESMTEAETYALLMNARRAIDRTGGPMHALSELPATMQPRRAAEAPPFYSALLAKAQGAEPRLMHVVLGDHTERAFRCADYMHYYRSLLARFMARVQALASGAEARTYPLPAAHCDLCHWRERCEAQRLADDHLCQVANSSRVQWGKLQAAGVVLGARVPIILTSRADSVRARLASCAVAVLMVAERQARLAAIQA